MVNVARGSFLDLESVEREEGGDVVVESVVVFGDGGGDGWDVGEGG